MAPVSDRIDIEFYIYIYPLESSALLVYMQKLNFKGLLP